ncbi:ThiS family [Mycobacteroides abscessus subsp. abscessus]|nr:ThiS family [Mycobacteroides abscessus subsp. abscessus]
MTLTVELRGTAEALLDRGEIEVSDNDHTVRGAVAEVASHHPDLARQFMTATGLPRESVKVLVNGESVPWSTPVSFTDRVKIISTLPCDG